MSALRNEGASVVARNQEHQARKKLCKLCVEKVAVKEIDYKDATRLRRFISEDGKILGRRITGNCADHQKGITLAVKRSREIALVMNGF